MKYLLRDGQGRLFTFKGAAKLDVLLQTSDVGKLIQVKFVGLDATRDPKPGFSPAKLFEVAVDDDSAEQGHTDDGAPLITDDDLPF